VVTLLLTVCLVCPTLEVFDTWDPPIQTANDTEYGLVVAALCLGAAYLFVRATLEFPREGFLAGRKRTFGLPGLFVSTRRFDFHFSDTSPPALTLRI